MQVGEFYDYVRELTRANTRDLPDDKIAILADPEADYLYELSIQGHHLEQTENATPTVYTYNMSDDFQITPHNLWIERVEAKVSGHDYFTQMQRTNKTEYLAHLESCKNSLTDELDEATNYDCPRYFMQTSQGIHVFPIDDPVEVKVYVKDTPEIDWNNDNYEILLPDVPINLLALKTALMYRDINDTNTLQFLERQYAEKFAVFEKRIAKGGRVIQMGMKSAMKHPEKYSRQYEYKLIR